MAQQVDGHLEEEILLQDAISVEHLAYSYPGVDDAPGALVFEDMNLTVEEGSFVAVLGSNGCGKSTLAKHFNSILLPNGGKVYVYGMDSVDEERLISIRRTVGMVFQNPNPFPMSIYDNIAYGPRCQGVKNKDVLNKIVEESLKKAALYDEVKDRLKDSALGLSGGQQQRLCIARCIAMEPDVILMDEPTSALDPIATLKIEELINELKKEYTIIIVTHNMQQATRVSDYTAFFMLGEVIECAPTVELFSQPKNKKTEDYITGRFG